MPRYLATTDYRSRLTRNVRPGIPETVEVAFRAGEVYDIEPSMVAALVRDGAGVFDFSAPVTPEQLDEIEQRHEQERQAKLEAERQEQERQDAIARHVRAWGGHRCPGLRGQLQAPGYAEAGSLPHDEPRLAGLAGTGLAAQWVEAGECEGWWAVGCSRHVGHIATMAGPPEPPTRVDRSVRRYKATHAYKAMYSEFAPEGPRFTPVPHDERPKRLAYFEGEIYDVPTNIATWVNRDSAGTLALIDEGEQ